MASSKVARVTYNSRAFSLFSCSCLSRWVRTRTRLKKGGPYIRLSLGKVESNLSGTKAAALRITSIFVPTCKQNFLCCRSDPSFISKIQPTAQRPTGVLILRTMTRSPGWNFVVSAPFPWKIGLELGGILYATFPTKLPPTDSLHPFAYAIQCLPLWKGLTPN